MENLTTVEWLKGCQRLIDVEVERLSKRSSVITRAMTSSKDKKEAVVRLNLLLEVCKMDHRNDAFPTKAVMEEILMDQDYQFRQIGYGQFGFVVGAFELELMPHRCILEVRSIHPNRTLNEVVRDRTRNFRTSREYEVVHGLNNEKITIAEAARELAEISFAYEDKFSTESEMTERTAEKLIALEKNGLAATIRSSYLKLEENMKNEYLTQVVEISNELGEEINAMKRSGLYETLQLIENETNLRIKCDSFMGQYNDANGLKSIEKFLATKGKAEKELRKATKKKKEGIVK